MLENKEFYPTPKALLEKMTEDVNFPMVHSVLEPSAGKGDIVNYLLEKAESCSNVTLDIDCIEKDPNLRHILKGNDMRVVHDDFLTYDTMKAYDMIIMNPPFSEGCLHLQKAIRMQERSGGAIVCLLNAETLKNQCSNDRIALMKMIEQHNGSIEFIQDGFLDAERKTAVEVALVKVQIPKPEARSSIIDTLKRERKVQEPAASECAYLADNDFIKAIVDQYKMEVEAGCRLIREYEGMKPFILSEFKRNDDGSFRSTECILSLNLCTQHNHYDGNASINEYIRLVRKKYWKTLFTNPKFVGQLTENLQREYFNKVSELMDVEFSMFNVLEVKIDMLKHVSDGIEDAIIALFDEFSHKHYWYDDSGNNIHYYNGWKTNSAYMVNKKVIIPLNAFSSWSGRFETYHIKTKLQDMEKCFNYLDGGRTDALDLQIALKQAEANTQTKNIDLKYFTVTFYKKGTCHIVFKDEELLKKFNIYGSQRKGWLPPAYGKKHYSEMSPEEQTVVDEFDGKKTYEEVMSNGEFYFSNINMHLLDCAG